jgi:hypothetical protein
MCSFWTRLIDSRPPATTTDMPSAMICFAAIDTLMRLEEHWRSTLWPGTETGSPEVTTLWRATL